MGILQVENDAYSSLPEIFVNDFRQRTLTAQVRITRKKIDSGASQ